MSLGGARMAGCSLSSVKSNKIFSARELPCFCQWLQKFSCCQEGNDSAGASKRASFCSNDSIKVGVMLESQSRHFLSDIFGQ